MERALAPHGSRMTLRRLAPVVAVLLLAFALRVFTLQTRPLWYDDAFSVLLAERGPAAIASGTAADTMPPGYYLLLYAWMTAAGQTPLAMRWLSVGLGMLVVAVAFALGRRGFGERTGTWAAFLLALMPFQIYHAQELRMYTLLALGICVYMYGVLTLYLLQASPTSASPQSFDGVTVANLDPSFPGRAVVLIAVGTFLALYAHNLAFVSLLAGNLYLGVQALRRTSSWRLEFQLLLGQLVGVVGFVPWLLYVPTQLDKIQRAFWTQQPGLLDVVQLLMVFTTYLPLPPVWLAAALFICVLVLAFAGWQLLKLARRRELPALGLVVTFAVVPPVLLFGLSYLIRPVFVPRGVIGSAVAYVILLAVAAAQAPRRSQVGLGVLVLAIAAFLLPLYYSAYGEWRRAPYLDAAAFLRAERRDGDTILHDNKLSFLPMYLYDRALPQRFLPDPPGSDNDTFAPASQAAMQLYPSTWEGVPTDHRVWFVIYQTALDEAEQLEQPHPNLARLDAAMRRVQETAYGDLRILLYTPR